MVLITIIFFVLKRKLQNKNALFVVFFLMQQPLFAQERVTTFEGTGIYPERV